MQLVRVRLSHVGPHASLSWTLGPPAGPGGRALVLLGESGLGKTTLLAAIACTRPGLVSALPATALPRVPGAESTTPTVVTEWMLGEEDPSRPHPLVVASPNAALDEPDEAAVLRRREQALFERKALVSGFAFVAFSGARWFSRTPVVLSAPERAILRHEPRAASSFDDPTRADMARDAKQLLALVHIAAALDRAAGGQRACKHDFGLLDRALRASLASVLDEFGLRFVGCAQASMEPEFEYDSGDRVTFDDLPRAAKHLIAIIALTIRASAAAHPGRDPRDAEAVALVDDADLHLPRKLQERVPDLLERALPKAQWVLATTSPALAVHRCEGSVFRLRREKATGPVEMSTGLDAVLH